MASDPTAPMPRSTPPPFKGLRRQAQVAADVCAGQVSQADLHSLRDRIGETGWVNLAECGAAPDKFRWIVTIERSRLQSGASVEGGFLASSIDGQLHYFRYTASDGFQMASAAQTDVSPTVSALAGHLELQVTFSPGSSVSQCVVALDGAGSALAAGDWFGFWREACAKALGWRGSPERLCLVRVSVLVPEPDAFGTRIASQSAPTLLAADGPCVSALPAVDLVPQSPLAWWADENRVEILCGRGGDRRVVVLEPSAMTESAIAVRGIVNLLPTTLSNTEPLGNAFRNMGIFRVRLPDDDTGIPHLLEKKDTAVVVHADTPVECRYGTMIGSTLVLVSEGGVCVALDPGATGADTLLKSVVPPCGLQSLDHAGRRWTVALCDSQPCPKPVLITISDNALSLDRRVDIPFEYARDAGVNATPDPTVAALTVKWQQADGEQSQRLLAPTDSAYALWEEWDVGKARSSLANMGLPDLYRVFNADRRHEFLLAMYGDVLFLNRTLQAGIPISELLHRLGAVGSVKFSEDKSLRDETLTKIITLVDTTSQMKQRAEVFASLYPYYWTQQEADWLAGVFGAQTATRYFIQERKRLVPTLRRQIRGIQAELFRTLAQIEAASKPVEALLAREDLRKHWSTKARMLLPGVASAGIGVAMMSVSGAGIPMLASAIAIHGLGGILGHFQQDREGAAQIMRAAESVFPWWEILMETLPVSIYETGLYVDEENLRYMKRDRAMVDSAAPAHKPEVLKRLREQLMATAVVNRRKAFREVADGSAIRVADLFSDIKRASTEQVRDKVAEFASSMTQVAHRKGTGHG